MKAGLLDQQGNSCRLLSRDELADDWNPATDARLTVWEVTQHLIRAQEESGEQAAASLLRAVGGLAEPAYRLYHTSERKGWTSEALAYNSLVTAWPDLTTLAAQPPPGQTTFDLV